MRNRVELEQRAATLANQCERVCVWLALVGLCIALQRPGVLLAVFLATATVRACARQWVIR